MRKSRTLVSAAATALALAAPLFAGGFWLVLGNPQASPQARSMDAVLTVKAVGCHEPDKATVSGTAVGIVNGQRRSIPLKLAALPEPGMFALTRQWPAEGRWVIELVGTNQGAVTSVLAAAGPDGVDRKSAKAAMRQPTSEEIEALLRADPEPAAVARK